MRNGLAVLIIVLVAVSCQPKSEINQVKHQNDSLQREANIKDSALYALMNTFNAIENNLAEIKAKENIISQTASGPEDARTREDKINEEIRFIYDKMNENKEKVRKLEKKLKSANIKIADLQNVINTLKQKLIEQDAEIIRLNEELQKMNIQVAELSYEIDSLVFDNTAQKAVIAAQDESIHTSYYLFGTSKELKKMGIVEGGTLSLSRNKVNSDFDKSLFTKIDIRKDTVFVLGAKKVKILTSHPGSSYKLVGEKPVEKIVIINPEEFWSVSKYLIISM